MSRNSGLLGFSANFEVGYAQPLDARFVVPTKADLVLANTWGGFTYVGLVTSVVSDSTPANNGVYRLKAADYTQEANWEKVGSDTAPPAHADTTGLQGGTEGEYYHLTQAELAVVQATSGTNTGDQDLSGLLPNSHLTDFAHEDIAHTNRSDLDNVSGTNTGDETLTTLATTLGTALPKAGDVADSDLFPILDSEAAGAIATKTFSAIKSQLLADIVEAGVFASITVTSADSPYTATSVANNVYAVDLTDGNVVFNLPEVVPGIERHECYIYIERITAGNKLTINTFGTNTIRGQTSQELKVLRDSVHLIAHNYDSPHWDVFDWSRTDETIYNPGNAGVTSILTLQSLLDYQLSAGEISGCAITKVGDGTITVGAGEWKLRSSNSETADCRVYYVGASGVLTPTDNATSYLALNYSSGTPTWSIESSITAIPCTDKCLQAILHRRGTSVDYLRLGDYTKDFAARYAKASAVTNWLQYGEGLQVSATGARNFAVSAGSLYQGTIRFTTPAFNTASPDTFDYYYRNNSGGWSVTAASTQIDNTQYDNGSGTLATLSNNRFGVHWVYTLVDNPSRLAVVYGQGNYLNLAAAQAAGIPATLPPFAQKYSIGKLIAKIIIQKSAAAFADIQSPFLQVFTSETPVNHNEIAGLQGGTLSQYYHLTQAEYTVVQNTSGTNTGDETLASIELIIDSAPEKMSLADADRVVIIDSEDADSLKSVPFEDFKTLLGTKFHITSPDATISVNPTADRTFIGSSYAGMDDRTVSIGDGTFDGQEVTIADVALTAAVNPIIIAGSLIGDIQLTEAGQAASFVWIGTRWTALSFGANLPPANALTDDLDIILIDEYGNTLTA